MEKLATARGTKPADQPIQKPENPSAAVPPVLEPVPPVLPAARQPSANEVELNALKAGLVPVAELVAADPKVIEAKKALATMEAKIAKAKDWAVEIPKQVAQFRAEHPVIAARHDMGWKSPELKHGEKSLIEVQYTLTHASSWLETAKRAVSSEESSASNRIYMERRLVTGRIETLEAAVSREKAPEGATEVPSRPSAQRARSRPVTPMSHAHRRGPESGLDDPDPGVDR